MAMLMAAAGAQAGARITLIGSVVNDSGDAGASSLTTSLASLGLQEGDVLVVAAACPGTGDAAMSFTTAGYSVAAELFGDDTRDTNLLVGYKAMGATPDSQVVVSSGVTRSLAVMVSAWRNVDPTTPLLSLQKTATGINSSNPDGPAVSAPLATAVVLACGAHTGDTTVQNKIPPTNYTRVTDEVYDAYSTTGIGVVMGYNDAPSTGAGGEDPGAWSGGETGTSDSWAAVSIALRPVT